MPAKERILVAFGSVPTSQEQKQQPEYRLLFPMRCAHAGRGTGPRSPKSNTRLPARRPWLESPRNVPVRVLGQVHERRFRSGRSRYVHVPRPHPNGIRVHNPASLRITRAVVHDSPLVRSRPLAVCLVSRHLFFSGRQGQRKRAVTPPGVPGRVSGALSKRRTEYRAAFAQERTASLLGIPAFCSPGTSMCRSFGVLF